MKLDSWPMKFFLNTKLIIQNLFVWIVAFVLTGKLQRPNSEFTNTLKRARLFFHHKDRNVFDLSREWSACFRILNEGNFIKARNMRRAILEEVYSKNELDDDYFPPILSNQFFGPIGHHAFTGIHIAAQDLDLIPAGRRIGIVRPELNKNNFVSLLASRLTCVNFKEGSDWTELPSNWHLTERMQMIRSHNSFIECFELVDEVFRSKKFSKNNPAFKCDGDYIQKSRTHLQSLGLSSSDWFVGLHIRDGSPTPALRNQKIANYIPAIKEITRRGGWVIRIGQKGMPLFPKMDKVIDLVAEENAASDLHLFVLSECRFFIGTHSGPQWFPPLFGVPTIFTNHIAIGRCALTFSEHSFTIPKTALKRDGTRASLMELLESPLGYGELSLKEFEKIGFTILENSSTEILNSVLEMFERLEGRLFSRENDLNNRVSDIRKEFDWTSKGKLANSFLLENEAWFLS